MSAPATHGRSRQTGCELFAALMKADRTVTELVQVAGIARKNAELWLREMHASGLVYRRPGKLPAGQKGRSPTVYCLQSAPFEREDWA